MKRLSVAVMGLDGCGAEFLEAIRADDQFDLVAVADANADLLRDVSERLHADGFADYRSLIVEGAASGLDALFVAVEPFESVDLMPLAAERRVAVFHKAPFARDYGEAERLTARFHTVGCPMVIARNWQFEPVFQCLRRIGDWAGRIFSVIAVVRTDADGSVGWRGDSTRAGGGVLLNEAYQALDLTVALLGAPQRVYARGSMAIGPSDPKPYDTEDAALVVLDFPSARSAGVFAGRRSGMADWQVTIFAAEATVVVGPRSLRIHRADGSPMEECRVASANPWSCAISEFGGACRAGLREFASSAREHLATMAVIDAAYLSARTGSPESPDRILDVGPLTGTAS